MDKCFVRVHIAVEQPVLGLWGYKALAQKHHVGHAPDGLCECNIRVFWQNWNSQYWGVSIGNLAIGQDPREPKFTVIGLQYMILLFI